MVKVLVVYGTAYGQTRRIARRMVDRLADYGHHVSMYKGDHLPPDLSLTEYDAFVVAGSLIRGRYQRYIRDFVREHADRLNAGPSAFVSVSGAAADSPIQALEYVEEFLQQTGWRPTVSESFAGAIAYTKYGFFLRWITRLVSGRRGGPTDMSRDYDMTDWESVDRFAERLAESLVELAPMAGLGAKDIAPPVGPNLTERGQFALIDRP